MSAGQTASAKGLRQEQQGGDEEQQRAIAAQQIALDECSNKSDQAVLPEALESGTI